LALESDDCEARAELVAVLAGVRGDVTEDTKEAMAFILNHLHPLVASGHVLVHSTVNAWQESLPPFAFAGGGVRVFATRKRRGYKHALFLVIPFGHCGTIPTGKSGSANNGKCVMASAKIGGTRAAGIGCFKGRRLKCGVKCTGSKVTTAKGVGLSSLQETG